MSVRDCFQLYTHYRKAELLQLVNHHFDNKRRLPIIRHLVPVSVYRNEVIKKY